MPQNTPRIPDPAPMAPAAWADWFQTPAGRQWLVQAAKETPKKED